MWKKSKICKNVDKKIRIVKNEEIYKLTKENRQKDKRKRRTKNKIFIQKM